MKKTIFLITLILSTISCDKKETAASFKTAYVDTTKLMEEYTEAKDIEAKYKAKSEEMGKELDAEVTRFRSEAQNFQRNAQAYGEQWARQKGAELQQKEQQISYAQQAMMRQLQEESGKEMDSLVNDVKKFIKDYGKEKGYDYIYGTGDAASVLYAKDSYDITKELIKLLNDKYKNLPATEKDKKETKNNTESKTK